MSAALVKQGVIAPLEQRVPVEEDRLYSAGPDQIGVYGGISRLNTTFTFLSEQALSNFGEREADGFTWRPFVGKDWGWSEDGRTLQFQLREGLRWSDGKPFTMDDVEFAWTELKEPRYQPTIPIRMRDPVTDNPVRWTKVDDLNFTLTFDSPVYNIMESRMNRGSICTIGGMCWFTPKHHVSQFMPEIVGQPAVDAMMAADGNENFNSWWRNVTYDMSSADIPCARIMCVGGAGTENSQGKALGILTRNHYSWAFDPEGNQLPYLDAVWMFQNEGNDVAVFRKMAGENDQPITYNNSLTNVPLYINNMESGDYSIYRWPSFGGNDKGLGLQQTWNEDPYIGQLIRTHEFRQAISAALDRPAINEASFLGLGAIQNFVPRPDNPYYPGDRERDLYVQRDLAKSNQLLDGLGLSNKNDQGFRLRPDGEPLTLTFSSTNADNVSIAEAMAQQLAEVGLELVIRGGTNRARQGEQYLSFTSSSYNYNPWMLEGGELSPLTGSHATGQAIGQWYESSGSEGMAPGPDLSYLPLAPPDNFAADPSGKLQENSEMWLLGRQSALFSPGRMEAGKTIYRNMAEQIWNVPTVAFTGVARGIVFKRNNMRNIPKTHIRDIFGFAGFNYSFEDGEDNLNHPGNRSKLYKSVSFLDPEFYFDEK
jgi:peptide/nickel transport system substrate-binding protein